MNLEEANAKASAIFRFLEEKGRFNHNRLFQELRGLPKGSYKESFEKRLNAFLAETSDNPLDEEKKNFIKDLIAQGIGSYVNAHALLLRVCLPAFQKEKVRQRNFTPLVEEANDDRLTQIFHEDVITDLQSTARNTGDQAAAEDEAQTTPFNPIPERPTRITTRKKWARKKWDRMLQSLHEKLNKTIRSRLFVPACVLVSLGFVSGAWLEETYGWPQPIHALSVVMTPQTPPATQMRAAMTPSAFLFPAPAETVAREEPAAPVQATVAPQPAVVEKKTTKRVPRRTKHKTAPPSWETLEKEFSLQNKKHPPLPASGIASKKNILYIPRSL